MLYVEYKIHGYWQFHPCLNSAHFLCPIVLISNRLHSIFVVFCRSRWSDISVFNIFLTNSLHFMVPGGVGCPGVSIFSRRRRDLWFESRLCKFFTYCPCYKPFIYEFPCSFRLWNWYQIHCFQVGHYVGCLFWHNWAFGLVNEYLAHKTTALTREYNTLNKNIHLLEKRNHKFCTNIIYGMCFEKDCICKRISLVVSSK